MVFSSILFTKKEFLGGQNNFCCDSFHRGKNWLFRLSAKSFPTLVKSFLFCKNHVVCLLAAIEAGAQLDAMYHPGVWRMPMYTCCDSINKRAGGCKPATNRVAVSEQKTCFPSAGVESVSSLVIPAKNGTYE